MRYWGIWIEPNGNWVRREDGQIIFYPLASLAEAHVAYSAKEWGDEFTLTVTEFTPDEE